MEDNSQEVLLQALRQIKTINLEVLNVDEFSWEILLLPSSTSENNNSSTHTFEAINIDLHIQPPTLRAQIPRVLPGQDNNFMLARIIQKIKDEPAELSEWLRDKFYKPDDLRKLCQHLKVPFHELEGDGIHKITDLVNYLRTREKEKELIFYLEKYQTDLYKIFLRHFYDQDTLNSNHNNAKFRRYSVRNKNGYRKLGNTL